LKAMLINCSLQSLSIVSALALSLSESIPRHDHSRPCHLAADPHVAPGRGPSAWEWRPVPAETGGWRRAKERR
jgi:hypothetical protein